MHFPTISVPFVLGDVEYVVVDASSSSLLDESPQTI